MTDAIPMTQDEFGKLLGHGWVVRTVKTEGDTLTASMWDSEGEDQKIAIEKLDKPEKPQALPDAGGSPDEAEVAAAQAKDSVESEAEKAKTN